MPHVSKQKLDDQLYQELFVQLVELPIGLNKKQASRLFSSLLTRTEQLMLTKRCAAAIMFANGFSNYRVWSTLKISQSTAARLREQFDNGIFDGVLEVVQHKKLTKREREEFLETFNKIMRLGMPSMGKDRWKGL